MRTKTVGNLSEEIEKRAKDLCSDFHAFTHGVRYVALLHRSKDGGHQGSEYHRRGGFYITHGPEEYLSAVARLLTLGAVAEKPYRLYASVNARNIVKGERAFKMAMLECDFAGGENKEFFWNRLESKWVSALMQPGARDESFFLLDVDGEGDATAPVLRWLGAREIPVVKQYKTPNGWHIVTRPFNPTDFAIEGCEIKKDGLLLLEA